MKTDIGNKIHKIRVIKGFSQEYVASKLGISQNAYSKYEKGETKINMVKLGKISEIMEVTPEIILNFNEQVIFNILKMGQAIQIVNPIEKVEQLYERIIVLKDAEIAFLRSKIQTAI